MNFDFNIFAGQPTLPTIWFVVVGVFWIGYLILDSFDLGVGMLMSRFFAKNEQERRLLLNTIGPVWDGNEVWVVTGGAATFAAFPLWYASLFSALYVPLTLALLALIFRAVAIEYRGKKNDERWINGWNTAISVSSFFIALLVGALLALTSIGLPINSNGDRVGKLARTAGRAVTGRVLPHAGARIRGTQNRRGNPAPCPRSPSAPAADRPAANYRVGAVHAIHHRQRGVMAVHDTGGCGRGPRLVER